MTSMAQASAFDVAASSPLGASREGQAQSTTIQLATLMLALLIPTGLAYLLDERQTHGVSGWIKPMKFEMSLAIHFATLALLLALVAPAVRAGRLIRGSMLVAATLAVLEVAYMMVQAGRGRPSHFNNDTPLEEALYAVMGLGATTIVVATFLVGLTLWRHPRPDLAPGMRLAAAGGLMFSAFATLLIGGYMSQLGGHWVGGVPSDAGALPIVGWSTTGGDLRAPHFFATHAAQIVPLFALALQRARPNGSAAPVKVFLVGYAAFTAGVLLQALLGQPFLAWQ